MKKSLSKKMGRPTNEPKPYQIVTRIDENTKNILDTYCEQNKVSRNQGVRTGIQKLKDDIKK